MKAYVKPRYPTIEQKGIQKWEVKKPIEAFAEETNIYVPMGFMTDGASVPRIFWPIMPPMSETYTNAAVVHDYLYKTQKTKNRKTADKIFLNLMEYLGTPRWKRMIMYRAVRIGGWKPWKKKR